MLWVLGFGWLFFNTWAASFLFVFNDILLHLDPSAFALGKFFASHRWPFIIYICSISFWAIDLEIFADGSCWMYSGTSSPVCYLCFHFCFGCLVFFFFFFLSFLVWVIFPLFFGHKIGRHLGTGKGNGAKTSCTLLIIRFCYAGQAWDD